MHAEDSQLTVGFNEGDAKTRTNFGRVSFLSSMLLDSTYRKREEEEDIATITITTTTSATNMFLPGWLCKDFVVV